MPHYVVDRIIDGLNSQKKPLKGSKILIVGVTYKKDISDVRESPASTIINSLLQKEAKVEYYDPLVPAFDIDGLSFSSAKLTKETLNSVDCVVIVTDHSEVDYKFIVNNSKLIVDTRNALSSFKGSANIVTL